MSRNGTFIISGSAICHIIRVAMAAAARVMVIFRLLPDSELNTFRLIRRHHGLRWKSYIGWQNVSFAPREQIPLENK